ncbi:hypothetical protein ACFW04_008310 [Cataglyphis niger]
MLTNSLKDPVPGWIDNFNGPIGLLSLGAKGFLRVMYIDVHNLQNNVPIDIVINTIILEISVAGTFFWTPYTFFTENAIIHYVLSMLCHILPAIIIDLVLKFSGRQAM